jgi:hypothetical protein
LDYIRGKKKLSEHASNEIYTLIKTKKITPSQRGGDKEFFGWRNSLYLVWEDIKDE